MLQMVAARAVFRNAHGPIAAHFIQKGTELPSVHAIPAGVNIPSNQIAFPMVSRFLVGGLRSVAGGIEPLCKRM